MSASGTARRILVGLTVVALLAGCARGPQSVEKTADITYEASNPVLTPGVLDVYAPVKVGPWPVVVMFHGYVGDKRDLDKHARRVADLGFVVFSATWGAGLADYSTPTYDEFLANVSQGACAIEFARAHAAELTFTGGSGRFADAAGEADMPFWGTLHLAAPMTVTWALEGAIGY